MRHLLLVYVLMTYTFTSSMWFVAGSLMGLSRRAASDWLYANLLNGLALVLLLLDSGLPRAFCEAFSSNLLLISTLLLSRGMRSFFRLPQLGMRHGFMCAGACGLTFLVGLPAGLSGWGVLLSCLFSAFTMIEIARDSHSAMEREFHSETALAATVVMGITAAYYVLLGLGVPELGINFNWQLDSSILLSTAAMGLSICGSFILGYLVVMRLVYRLQHLSQHDSLTGLLNRRAIEINLERECQRLQRFGEPYSVMLVDIDHFKRINDTLGHAAGDEVLRVVASILKDHAREVDRVARYGGEEFCILLPHTDHDGALQAAERLRSSVHESKITWHDKDLQVTISTGLACATDPSEPLHALLKRADDALYQAKTGGRNRVIAAATREAA